MAYGPVPLTMALYTLPKDPIPSSPAVNPLVASLNSWNEKWRMFGTKTSELAEDDVIPVDVESPGEDGVKRDEEELLEFCREGVNGV